jgi:hypothetical protein
MATTNTLTLELERETTRDVVSRVENHDLYRAVIAAQAGEHIDDCLIDAWSQHWPVIGTDLRLTGTAVDSEGGWWSIWNDQAAINTEEALAAGWTVADGYAFPPTPIL